MNNSFRTVLVILLAGLVWLVSGLVGRAEKQNPDSTVGLYLPYRHTASQLLINTSNGKLCWPANLAQEGQIVNFPACGRE